MITLLRLSRPKSGSHWALLLPQFSASQRSICPWYIAQSAGGKGSQVPVLIPSCRTRRKKLLLGKNPFYFCSDFPLRCWIGGRRDMEKLMHLILLVSLSELCVAENTTVVYGMEGETITISCAYSPKENKWREKSWCKHVNKTECQRVVSARRFWLQFLKKWNGNTSIADNIHTGVLTVTLERLQKQDAGLYQCKTDFLGEARTLKKVKVEVLGGVMETQAPDEPKALHSISSLPEAHFNAFVCIITLLLVAKFLTAVLIFTITSRQRSGAMREGSHNLN
ncbi:triggering receptor expressed on myeloid cells 2-like isoform X2 [Gopherus flavomarginatus]|uniref:triggering receptor expressed on myeloid cells 2-like isoform X2 n=1 Tax=Gopherus flavomarginatus TaxID=286002 RepID=UPI0021CC4AC9|nr:triggering receptor expressed on myeloid cells 2-like isoform X2 [Gopherus flavomarginatus]